MNGLVVLPSSYNLMIPLSFPYAIFLLSLGPLFSNSIRNRQINLKKRITLLVTFPSMEDCTS